VNRAEVTAIVEKAVQRLIEEQGAGPAFSRPTP